MLPSLYRSNPDIRRHQITTLKIFNANVVEVCEGLEYNITFTSGRNDLSLTISLSNDFPNEKPLLKINPIIVHPWVNAEGEITSAPGLLNFTIHSDLGRVVQAITREFERNPPPLLNECTSTSNLTSPTGLLRDSGASSPSFIANKNFSPPSTNNHHHLIFPELNNLSIEELEFLNRNSDRQQQFVNELPPIKEQNKVLDELITQIEELAESNLAKQEHLKELKANVDEKIEEVTKLAFENERLHNKYQNISQKYAPANIKSQLRLAAEKAEEESEKIAEEFLNGTLDVDKFVSLYLKHRTLCQTRKTKEEKLSQQLDSLQKASY